jgi:hypothetical protein
MIIHATGPYLQTFHTTATLNTVRLAGHLATQVCIIGEGDCRTQKPAAFPGRSRSRLVFFRSPICKYNIALIIQGSCLHLPSLFPSLSATATLVTLPLLIFTPHLSRSSPQSLSLVENAQQHHMAGPVSRGCRSLPRQTGSDQEAICPVPSRPQGSASCRQHC